MNFGEVLNRKGENGSGRLEWRKYVVKHKNEDISFQNEMFLIFYCKKSRKKFRN